MNEHVCEWHFFEESSDGAFCVNGCHGRLSRDEAEARINATEKLSVIYDSIDDYLAPVTAKNTTEDEYVPVEASTLAWWMDAIEDTLRGKP